MLHDSTEVNSYQSGDSVAIQIIEGELKIHTSLKTIIPDEGQVMVFKDKEKFRLTTLEESSFILTISADSLQ